MHRVFACDHGICFGKIRNIVRVSYGKTAFGNLVLVSSGYGAKIAECLAVLFIKNRERKLIGSVDKFFLYNVADGSR